MGDPATLGHTLNRVGNWYANNEQPGAGRRAQAEALALFEELGDPTGQAATLDLLGANSLMDGDALASTAYYERAIALFRARQDRWGLATSLGPFALRGASYATTTILAPPADAARCRQEGEEAVAWAHQIDWQAGEAFALVYLALALGPRGAYGRALQAAQEGLRIATEIEHPITLAAGHYTLGAVYLDLLLPEAALPHTEQALALAQGTGALYLLRAASAFHAATCLARHDLVQAAAVLDAALAADAPMATLMQRLLWSQRAEQALAQHRADVALTIVERLIATAAHMAHGAVIPHLWYLHAQAVLALGHQAEGEALLRAAQAAAQEQELPPLLWRIQARLGRVLHAQGRRSQAEVAFAAARAIIAELAAGLPDARLRAQFAARAGALLPPAHPPTPRQATKRAFGDLTEREREVVALIAQGKTNPEIAAALILSKRTVQVHVTNILAKLGFQSRAQIAAWSVEKGLVSRSEARPPE
jgi:DNA-binding NarL/FixJ family response regulator